MSILKHPFVAPFALFMALMAVRDGINYYCEGVGPFLLAHPEHWIFPLQTFGCGFLLFRSWRSYGFRAPAAPAFTLGIAIFVLILWISPQAFWGAPSRAEGFDPTLFADNRLMQMVVVGLRFLRLVVVVPLLEEIFWRGFLMRYFVDPRFESVPFGTFDRKAFGLTALFFGLAHFGPDFPAALVTGLLYNWVACRTKSLSACVLAHAVTNLLLGVYIMATKQWGFW
jgi:CAAX prenyl protease-like protein